MHRLLLTATGNQLSGLSADDLLWRPHGEPSSVETTLGPRLEGIGDVPPLYMDFVRLAATVFFVDRTVIRPRMLRRSLDVEVAVHAPTVWESHSARLEAVLGLLSGDEWTLSFRRGREPRQGETRALDPADVSLLFSGGADSMCGALLARDEGLRPLLVSHFDWRNIGGQQASALDAYEQHLGQRPANIRWRFARCATQVGSGATFPNETSRRTRSLLFMAFGAAVSAVTQTDLWIANTKLFRYGSYPPQRGTLWSLERERHILYTRGSVPFYETYPGLYVPRPIEFRVHDPEQTPEALAAELLALTKMNWNNTQFDQRDPITLRAADEVSDILRYVPDGGYVEPSYAAYM